MPLLPADCASRPCPVFGGPVDFFGDHAVSCKKSGFGDRNLGPQTLFWQVLTRSRGLHDREVDIAVNGRRPADILLKAWDGRWDHAVDLTIVHTNQVAGRPLRGSAATCLNDKVEQKCRKSAESCGRMEVYFSPMVIDTCGGLHGAGKKVVKAPVQRSAPARRQPSGSRCPETGPQRATGPLAGPTAGGPNDGVNRNTGMVGGRGAAHPRIHGGG